jgi:hypothetical protein
MAHGQMTPGALLQFIWLLEQFVRPPLLILPNFIGQIKTALGASERLLEILDIPPERTDGAGFFQSDCAYAPNLPEILSFQNVTFAYDRNAKVLDDLSFNISQGPITNVPDYFFFPLKPNIFLNTLFSILNLLYNHQAIFFSRYNQFLFLGVRNYFRRLFMKRLTISNYTSQ